MKKNFSVILGVTGSIAAYKAAELVRLMAKRGWDVHVIMTASAKEFVSELTFRTISRNPVACGMFENPEEWMPGHISLADMADVIVVAPCTANTMAKIAHGLADDILSCTILASCAPIVLAVAMNSAMWKNPATRENLRLLESRGVKIVEGEAGELACGDCGKGRMAEPADIVREIERCRRSAGKKEKKR